MSVGVSKPTIRKAGGFTVHGLNELYQKVSDVLTATQAKNLKGVFMEAGRVGYESVVGSAPYDPKHNPDSAKWHIRDAVFLGAGDPNEPNVMLGVNYRKAPQALWLTFGTVKTQAKPFFKPAVDKVRQEMGTIIVNGLKQVIVDTAK